MIDYYINVTRCQVRQLTMHTQSQGHCSYFTVQRRGIKVFVIMMSHKRSIVSWPLLLPNCPASNSNVVKQFWGKNRKFCRAILLLPFGAWRLAPLHSVRTLRCDVSSGVIRRMSSKINERQRASRCPLKTSRVIEHRPRAVQNVDRTKPRRRYCYRPGRHGHPNARSHAPGPAG